MAATALGVALATMSLARAYAFEASYDLGYFRQAAWLIAEGRDPYMTIRGLSFLADHMYLTFFPVGWATRVLPVLPTLLGLQAAALALGVVPLYRLARSVAGLTVPVAGALVVAYSFSPALHGVNLADFHPETFAVPALIGAVLFALTGRGWPYLACVAFVLATREDLAIVVAGLGVLLVLCRRRRVGALTTVGALAWFLVATGISASLADGENVQASLRLPQYGDSTAEIVTTMLLHPWDVVGDLLVAATFDTFVALMAPVLFLALLAPRYLLPAVPLQVIYLISSVDAARSIDSHYPTAFIPFAFVAAAMALGRAGQRHPGAPVLAAKVLVISAVAFFVRSTTVPFEDPTEWAARTARDRAMSAAIDLLPADAAVSANTDFWPHMASRAEVFSYPRPFADVDGLIADPVPLEERQRRIDYILVDAEQFGLVYGPLDQAVLRVATEDLGFEPIFDDEGISLLRRGRPRR